ncbi:hypothetical protein [Nostoc sp.]
MIVKLGNQEAKFEEKDLQFQTKKPSRKEVIASVDKILEQFLTV